ncbi:MAG: AmmeMemoRadiSam system protein A [Coriobacteriales bacterium]|jgi:AmmeMemoRadiSam system protein A|nr:AmmeMemoRadiSam system protein A [Coriobacteriales bacterium]
MSILAAFAVPHPPLLIPGVGGDSRLQVQKTENAYREVAARSAALSPETLVFFSPHATLYYDYFHISPGSGAQGDFGSYGSQAHYAVAYDEEFVAALETLLAEEGIPGGTQGEREPTLDHGVMVPLHFFGEAAGDPGGAGTGVRIVRVGLSGLSRQLHREFGTAVARTSEALGRKTVIVASGDLSHKLLASGPYGYAPEGPEFDRQLCAALADGSVAEMLAIDEYLAEAAAECGLRSFIMMGGALEGLEYEPELLSYEGPFGVGYAVAASLVANPSAPEGAAAHSAAFPQAQQEQEQAQQDESLPVMLARRTLQSYFGRGGQRPTLDTPEIQALLEQFRLSPRAAPLYEELAHARAGAFVSLHENGELRGCIGTIAPVQENVLAEIVHNAVSAAVEDPRFPPVEECELPSLVLKVDVLGEAEPVSDRATLDAQRYGVIVSLGYRRGLLLPALDGVDTPEQQIAIALSKAGIGAGEPYELERFEVVRYT